MRTIGTTTVIIEDVAFPVPQLAAAVRELQALFIKYAYHEALIFGHALEGNLHFVFTQDFGSDQEVARYKGLMDEVCELVVDGYDEFGVQYAPICVVERINRRWRSRMLPKRVVREYPIIVID